MDDVHKTRLELCYKRIGQRSTSSNISFTTRAEASTRIPVRYAMVPDEIENNGATTTKCTS